MPPIPQCSECCRTAYEVGALRPTAWGTLLCETCHQKRDPDPPREKKAKTSPHPLDARPVPCYARHRKRAQEVSPEPASTTSD